MVHALVSSAEFQKQIDSDHPEKQYLDLVARILRDGHVVDDRTGTGTLSLFGAQMRFPLEGGNQFPLLTTKRVFWRGIVEELLWFIKGDTNSEHLSSKGVHIWDANGSRAFLDGRGLNHYRVNDLGPIYGFQWRHFGAIYNGMNEDYTGRGVDQLAECIRKIKETPNDRRIILSAWNPAQLDQMALPPCHMFSQFHVHDKKLSCIMYQRSCDMGLGVPFNIASYALLTCMIAHVTNLVPGEFIHMLGDAHIYLNHCDALKQQLQRSPNKFPSLRLNREITSIEDFTYSDIILEDYKPHSTIPMTFST